MPLSWPAAGLSSLTVYKLTGISYFQVVGTNSSSGNVGHSGFLFASSEWYWCALPRRNSHSAFIKVNEGSMYRDMGLAPVQILRRKSKASISLVSICHLRGSESFYSQPTGNSEAEFQSENLPSPNLFFRESSMSQIINCLSCHPVESSSGRNYAAEIHSENFLERITAYLIALGVGCYHHQDILQSQREFSLSTHIKFRT